MIAHQEVSSEVSLFDAIDGIVRFGYALVRGNDRRITGIVTTTDLGLQFGRLAEPFLLLGEIENYLRRLLNGRVPQESLQRARDPGDAARAVNSVYDMTFGEYVRVLENPGNWGALNLPLDRDLLVKDLHEIRRIRNDVMHFDPDGVSDDDLTALRRSVQFFQRLAAAGTL